MRNPSQVHHLAESIAGLVDTITEIIDSTVKERVHPLLPEQPLQAPPPPATVQVATFDPIMKKRQLAAHFQVSIRTIDNWMQKGFLPHYKIGKVVRFRLSDVQGEWDAKLKRLAYRSWR